MDQARRLVTEMPGPRSRGLHARRTAAVTSAVGSTLPAYVERAGGAVIVDVDAAQAAHPCFMVSPHEGYVAVCERLTSLVPVRRAPGDGGVKAALLSSGAEAVENAAKVARTGDLSACQDEGVEPDIVALAKGIAGGLPRAAIEREHLAAAARRIGERVVAALAPLADDHPGIGEVRGRGAMLAMELLRPGTVDPDPSSAAAISAARHAAGVVTLVCGTGGDVLRLLPPLVIDDDLLDDALEVLGTAVGATLTGGS